MVRNYGQGLPSTIEKKYRDKPKRIYFLNKGKTKGLGTMNQVKFLNKGQDKPQYLPT